MPKSKAGRTGSNTRYKDKNGENIRYGDILHVENKEYDFDGVVEYDWNWHCVAVAYYDMSSIGEMTPLNCFPVSGREIIRRFNNES